MHVNMGGEISTAAPTGIAGTSVARVQLLQADPVSEPFSSKLGKNQEGYSGILALIGSDLAKESQEAKVEEDHSQQEYEAFMAESAASRAQKVKEIEELKDARAAVSMSSVQSKDELASAVTSASETAKVTSALHHSCDWLLQDFGTRKRARAGEIEGLNNAKAVLAGANYSLRDVSESESFSKESGLVSSLLPLPRSISFLSARVSMSFPNPLFAPCVCPVC